MKFLIGLFSTLLLVATFSASAQVPMPLTNFCNRSDRLYADGSSNSGHMPMLQCSQAAIVYQRSNTSFPLRVVYNGQISQKNANYVCRSARAVGAEGIVYSIRNLCNISLGRGSCDVCD